MNRNARWFRAEDLVLDLNLVTAVNKTEYDQYKWEVTLIGPTTVLVNEDQARNIMAAL